MKKTILFASASIAIMFSCGPSKEELAKQQELKTKDSLIRVSVVRDSVNKVNGARISDSISAALNEAMK